MILCEDFLVWDLKMLRRQANLCALRNLKLKKKIPTEINFKITTSKRKEGNKK